LDVTESLQSALQDGQIITAVAQKPGPLFLEAVGNLGNTLGGELPTNRFCEL
jgi:hypothetical protein